MPAFVNRRFGESGINEDEGTMVCCFDLKKSRNDWRICVLVIMAKSNPCRGGKRARTRPREPRKVAEGIMEAGWIWSDWILSIFNWQFSIADCQGKGFSRLD